jgi:hypothetical protein
MLFHGSWACFVAVTLYMERHERMTLHDRH